MKKKVILAVMTMSLLFAPMAYAYGPWNYHEDYRCYQRMTGQGYYQYDQNMMPQNNNFAHCR